MNGLVIRRQRGVLLIEAVFACILTLIAILTVHTGVGYYAKHSRGLLQNQNAEDLVASALAEMKSDSALWSSDRTETDVVKVGAVTYNVIQESRGVPESPSCQEFLVSASWSYGNQDKIAEAKTIWVPDSPTSGGMNP